MRKSTISSSSATLIARVIDVLAAAGLALRSFLHLTSMREHLGYRFEQRRPGNEWGNCLTISYPGNKRPVLQPAFVLASGITAQIVCPTPRLSQTRANWQG
jgi:hypothetical protein